MQFQIKLVAQCVIFGINRTTTDGLNLSCISLQTAAFRADMADLSHLHCLMYL